MSQDSPPRNSPPFQADLEKAEMPSARSIHRTRALAAKNSDHEEPQQLQPARNFLVRIASLLLEAIICAATLLALWVSLSPFLFATPQRALIQPDVVEPTSWAAPDYLPVDVPEQKVFIASVVSGEDSIEAHWVPSLTELIETLGPSNVFISVVPSDDSAKTRRALLRLKETISGNASLSIGSPVDLSELPQIRLASGSRAIKKSVYDARLRNVALQPLNQVSLNLTSPSDVPTQAHGRFDKILFLDSDIIFRAIDALRLMFFTNYSDESGKSNYGSACSIGPQDKFSFTEYVNAVPVKACWGGMNAFQAEDFQDKDAIRFRATESAVWDAPPACLLHADKAHRHEKTCRKAVSPGVYVNPQVQIAKKARRFVQPVSRWQDTLRQWAVKMRASYDVTFSHVIRRKSFARLDNSDLDLHGADLDAYRLCPTVGVETIYKTDDGRLFAKYQAQERH